MNEPKRQYAGRLLIGDDPQWRWQVTAYRSEWITDVYGFARAELFVRDPKISDDPARTNAGKILRRVFSEHSTAERISGTSPLYGEGATGKPVVLLHAGSWRCVLLNRRVYEGWLATGLTPFIGRSGIVTWRGQRNGSETVWGGFMAMRISSGFKFGELKAAA